MRSSSLFWWCHHRIITALASVWLVALGAVPTVSAAQALVVAKRASEIDPRVKEHPEIGFVFTDAKGKALDLQHAIFDPSAPSQGRLVIWLMDFKAELFERVASYGLHGIQVTYANRWFSTLTTEQHAAGNVIGDIRLEAATGADFSPVVSIPKPDGIMERAFQFVSWLAKEQPQGAWQQFITADGTALQWDKIIISGISHGATTAARFAMHQRVDRVVMFSGPRDNTESWQSLPSATPSNRFFGFTHVLDGGWVGDHYCRSWILLNLHQHGPLVDVDAVPAPFGNSRRLITAGEVKNDQKRAHNAVIPGKSAVKGADGRYLHESVWRYLFTHPVDQTGVAVEPEADCTLAPSK